MNQSFEENTFYWDNQSYNKSFQEETIKHVNQSYQEINILYQEQINLIDQSFQDYQSNCKDIIVYGQNCIDDHNEVEKNKLSCVQWWKYLLYFRNKNNFLS